MIPRIVLDTNVLVSAFLKPSGHPGTVLRHIRSASLILLLDERILLEYREVLRRPEFGFNPGLVDETMAYFDRFGEFVAATPLALAIPDPDDLPFLEVALSGKADALVTGNKKDFGRSPKDLKIVSPQEFLTEILPRLYVP
jgi:putative PIN family toxin of toxin-antitoxin system